MCATDVEFSPTVTLQYDVSALEQPADDWLGEALALAQRITVRITRVRRGAASIAEQEYEPHRVPVVLATSSPVSRDEGDTYNPVLITRS